MTDHAPQLDAATIRAALDQCMTLADIEETMGWSAGTGARTRWRPEPVGLPEPDHFLGRTPVWFRVTFEGWRAARPGMGVRPVDDDQPRARDRREVPAPPPGYCIATDGLGIPDGVAVLAHVHGSWRAVKVSRYNRRSLTVRYRLDDAPDAAEHVQRVGIARVAVPAPVEDPGGGAVR